MFLSKSKCLVFKQLFTFFKVCYSILKAPNFNLISILYCAVSYNTKIFRFTSMLHLLKEKTVTAKGKRTIFLNKINDTEA
jgi:hypothetical protein